MADTGLSGFKEIGLVYTIADKISGQHKIIRGSAIRNSYSWHKSISNMQHITFGNIASLV